MHSFFNSRLFRSGTRLLFLFIFLLLQAGIPLQGNLGDAQAAPALDPQPVPAMDVGEHAPVLDHPNTAIPTLTLGLPSTVMLGSEFTFTATFDNTGADPGYGPFIDLIFPATGKDGDDGVTFLNASFKGAPIPAEQLTIQTFPDDGGGFGCVQHPVAVRPAGPPPGHNGASSEVPVYYDVCGNVGDQFVTIVLPFGSFVPSQPPASVTITAEMSELADLDDESTSGINEGELSVYGQAGFQFGETAINDFCCGPYYDATLPVDGDGEYTVPGDFPVAETVEPTLLTISKSYLGPEGETATGPNYPRQFSITVDIAEGQTIGVAGDAGQNLVISDTLPNNVQYLSLDSSSPAGASCIEPSTTTPGGTLTCTFDSVTGGAGESDATLIFNYFVDRLDSGSVEVINHISGAPTISGNTAQVDGVWDPTDIRDPNVDTTGTCGTPCVSVEDQSIVVQKGVSVANDAAPAGNTPGDTLEYTLDFQISDFFGFEAIDLTDTFSDAQRFDDSFTPMIQINGNGGNDLATVAMDMDNVDIACKFTSGSYPSYCDQSPALPPPNDVPVDAGKTTIVFNLSDELIFRGFNGQLLGGCVDPTAANNPPDCSSYNDGGTTGTITFRTVIQDQFTDGHLPSPPNSGDPSVDHGDLLSNDVDIEGDVLDISLPPVGGVFTTTTGGTPTDDSAAGVAIAFGGLDKSIFAVNGSIALPEYISPGDVVTYRLIYTQPTSDFEETVFTDYLPLPVFSSTEVTSLTNQKCEDIPYPDDVPPAGEICLGPSDNYHNLNTRVPAETNPVVTPVFSVDGVANSLTITFPEYDSITNTDSIIDILFSLTVESDPFADGLFLTNQASASEGTTNAGDQTVDDIIQIKIGEPVLYIGKTAVSSDNPDDRFVPEDASVDVADLIVGSFTDPGNAGIPFAVPITSNDLSSDPADESLAFNHLESTLHDVDGNDLVKYAIVIENRGHGADGAFDIAISDILPPGMLIPAGGLNLQIYNGAGTAFGFEVVDFGANNEYDPTDSTTPGNASNADSIFSNIDPNTAIRLVDPAGVDVPGACQVHDLVGGANVIIITYDLQVPQGETDSTTFTNEASLLGYGSQEGGENFLEDPIKDEADIVTAVLQMSKVLDSTEYAPPAYPNNGDTEVVIGEIATYEIEIKFYELNTQNAVLVDTLDPGLAFVDLLSVVNSNPDPGTGLTSSVMTFDGGTGTCTNCVAGTTSGVNNPLIENNGGLITLNFGDMTNNNTDNDVAETITVRYRVVATNAGASDAGDVLSNSAVIKGRIGSADVTVIEPQISTEKDANPTAVDAGNTVTYTVTLSNGTGTTDTDAYDVAWSDTLPVGATYVGGTLALGVCPNAPDALSDAAAPLLAATWDGANAFPQNSSCEITFDVTVDYSVTPGETLTNTADTTWTSLPGDVTDVSTYNTNSDERIGDDLGGTVPQNDYTSTDDADVVINNPAVMKYIITTSEVHTSDDASFDGSPGNERPVAIGEIIRYRIVTSIPEGTSPNFQVNDRLPNGLIFLNDNTVEISFVSDGGISSAGVDIVPAIPAACNVVGNTADATTPVNLICSDDPATPISNRLADENIASTMTTTTNTDNYSSGADVYFRLGDLVNNDSDGDAEYVVIEFNAIVHNSETHRNDAGEDKSNSARAYIDGSINGAESNTVEVNIVEPHLIVDKNIVTAANDAGDPMIYRISITNDANTFFSTTNAAAAFDLSLSDSLDSNLNLQSITIYTAGEHGSLSGLTSCGATAQTVTDTSTTGVGGIASVDISCLNPGETLVVDVNTVVIDTAPAGITIPNAATITGTSLPGGDAGNYDSDGNSTGSDVPGNPGDNEGERDGSDTDSGGKDDYYDSDSVDATLDMPSPVKSIVSTSEAHTDESGDGSSNNSGDTRDLVIGEIMRYRLAVYLPEGTNADFTVEDVLPAGLTFVSGTLELQYWADNDVTNADATASTDLNSANSGALSVPVTYFSLSGQTLIVDLESPINNDINDGNAEYVILEFNVLVNNDATNQNTTVHDNDFTVQINGGTPISSNMVYSEVLEPKLYITKTTVDAAWIYGETVTYSLEVGHVSDADPALDSTEDAYDIVITDDVPSELTYVSADLTGASGWTASFSDPTLTLSCLASSGCSLPLDNSVTITFTATVNNPLPNMPPVPDSEYLDGTETVTNIADMVWTSLPGAGTIGNPTGSNTPGASGDTNGERNGNATGENDYNDSDSQDGRLNYYALGNRVWFDTDNDAAIDFGTELGVAGVDVYLYDAATMTKIDTGPDGIPGTVDDGAGEVTTDANGFYLFDYLVAGDYIVVIPAAELGVGGTLEGYYSSQTYMDGTGGIIEIVADNANTDNDDNDDNGTLDLDALNFPGAVISHTVTLGPVGETEPTADDDFANGTSEDSDQIDGRSNLSVDFGFYKTAIGNLVWLDVVPDGTYISTDDTLLNGVTVQLHNGITDALIASTTTTTITTDGEYLFDGLAEGEYVVKVVAPAQTVSTRDDNPQNDNDDPDVNVDDNDNGDGTSTGTVVSATLTMNPGDDAGKPNRTTTHATGTTTDPTVDFGFAYAYALGNRVWFDTNNDSSINFGTEVGVNDVTVELYAADASGNPTGSILATDVTATDGVNDGYYLFDYLFPGDYVVVIPAGEFDSSSPLGGTLEGYWSSATTLNSSGALNETAAPDPDLGPDGAVGGGDDDLDSDDNGTLDTSGGTFGEAVVSQAITLGPGLTSEPGGETDLEGGSQGDQPDARANMTVDFGFYKTEIGNLVFGDVNKGGDYSVADGDILLENVTVRLFSSDGTEILVGLDGIYGTADDATGDVLTDVQTNASGVYSFSGLPQGDYIVKATTPEGALSTRDDNPQNDNDDPDVNIDDNDNGVGQTSGDANRLVSAETLTMTPGSAGAQNNNTVTDSTGTTSDTTVDFGFTTVYALGNRVWYDTNNSAAMDNGEGDDAGTKVGADGVLVELYEDTGNDASTPTGTFVSTGITTTTANGGYYLFDGLQSGHYRVVIPATEFDDASDTLYGYWSSETSRADNGTVSETTAALPETNTDLDDNGTLDTSGGALGGAVVSDTIILGLDYNPEPTAEGDTDINANGTLHQGNQPDAQANMTVDFGFYTITLGDLVWNDADNSGVVNSESGIQNVTVQLLSGDGTNVLFSDDTDASGNYSFTGLPTGNYILRIPEAEFQGTGTLRDYYSSTGGGSEPAPAPDSDLDDSDDNGSEVATLGFTGGYIRSDVFALTPAGEQSYNNNDGTTAEPRIDFGVYQNPIYNLSITKSDGDGSPYYLQGGTVQYEITVTNNGPADVVGAIVTDNFPAAITAASWTCAGTGSASCTASGTGNISDNVDIPYGDSITYSVTATVSDTATGDIVNTASVEDPDGHIESDDHTDEESSLTVTKDDGYTVVSPETQLTYTIVITNTGDTDLTDLTVIDTLPAEVDFVSASDNGTESGGVVTWTHTDLQPFMGADTTLLAPGEVKTVTVTVDVKAEGDLGGSSSILNQVTVEDSNGTTDDDDDEDILAREHVKTLLESNHAGTTHPTVTIGEILTYRTTLTVPAGVTMTNVQAVDTLDAGLAFVDCAELNAPADGRHDLVVSSADLTSTEFTFADDGFGNLTAACNHGINPVGSNPLITTPPDASDPAAGREFTLQLGTVANADASNEQTVELTYRVVVLDIAENNSGTDDLNNIITWTWDGGELTGQAEEVEVVEPDMDIDKSTDREVAPLGSIIPFTLEIYQTDISTADAYDVVVTDVLPDALEYVNGSVSAGSPIPYDSFNYDPVTHTLTFTWDYFPLNDGAEKARTTITFDTTFVGPSPVTNEARVEWTSLPIDPTDPDYIQSDYNDDSTERWYDPADDTGVDDYGRTSEITIRVPPLPATGFAPNQVTQLPAQTTADTYNDLDQMRVEIPKLGQSLSIVGVPLRGEGWDLTWLDAQAGYLEGTAYPGLPGNTAITGHVYLADGSPGPFVNLHNLMWGDEIILYANGQRYTYQVRTIRRVWPNDLSVLKHEEYDWLTLVTCQGYNESDDAYTYRVAVRAVLIDVQDQ